MTSSSVVQKYFCYTCEENVTNIIQNEEVIKCLNCNQEFVEIVDEEDEDAHYQQESSSSPSNTTTNTANASSNTQTFPNNQPFNIFSIFDGFFNNGNARATNANNSNNFVINFQVINNFAQAAAQGRQQPQVLPNGVFFANNRNGMNLGDFAFGDMQHIIQNLVDNNRVGPPPTSKSTIDKLPEIIYHSNEKKTIVDDNNDTNGESKEMDNEQITTNPITHCAVCKDNFLDGEVLTVLPCKHNYHRDCILPWLNNANNCPICRYRLPTDDKMYEHIQQIREQQQQQRSSSLQNNTSLASDEQSNE